MPRRDIDLSDLEPLSMSLPPGLDGSTSLPGTLERRRKGRGRSEEPNDEGTDGSMSSKPLLRGTRYIHMYIGVYVLVCVTTITILYIW